MSAWYTDIQDLICCAQITWLRQTGATSAERGIPDLPTVGKTTYTGDTRMKSSFSYPNNWRLEMDDLQKKDSGLYVCHPLVGLQTVIRVRGENILHSK